MDWSKLLETLKCIGVDWRDRRLIAALYMDLSAVVRLKDGLTDPGAGMVGAVGKISAFRPQGPQFDSRLCRDLN